MHHVFVDFEMTCWRSIKEVELAQPEIIEIGAVKLDNEYRVVDTFSLYIKPEYNPQITKTCTKITGITTETLEGAPSFKEAMPLFIDWLGTSDLKIYAWGRDDKQQLEQEYRIKGLYERLPHPFKKWRDFQGIFMRIFDFNRRIGLTVVLEMLGIDFEGKQHRAVDDAFNSAKLLMLVKDPVAYKKHKARLVNVYNRKDTFTSTIGDLMAAKLAGFIVSDHEEP